MGKGECESVCVSAIGKEGEREECAKESVRACVSM